MVEKTTFQHDSKAYHMVELDGADEGLGQGDAAVLRMDEEKALREEADLSYKQNIVHTQLNNMYIT